MRPRTCLAAPALLAALCVGFAAPAAAFDGGDSRVSDPCGFYRGQAYGRGLTHYATEMLWACEAIAARRAADQSLGVRLEAVDHALERYRDAVVAAGRAAFAARPQPARSGGLGASEAIKASLAESTGMLAALEAIRTGY